MEDKQFKAFWVTETSDGVINHQNVNRLTGDLPKNGVLIKVRYSSLNYKDALSASGNKGVTRQYPHTPGIDAAGYIEVSDSPSFKSGDEVLVTGYDLGMNTSGGFGGYINVPSGWVVPKPAGLTPEECMILGTAGFTAALALRHMLRCGQEPAMGPILVTGATGGVGSLCIALLAKKGFEVIASTGKHDKTGFLKRLGATTVIDRKDVDDKSNKSLLRPRWAGVIDTVGGNTLATALKACSQHGNVCTCGNVSSPLLETTVFPFILNGVSLLGVNSATTPMALRRELWQKLAGEWKPGDLHNLKQITSLEGLGAWIQKILAGEVTGRVVIEHD